jgi:hypothetical protein
MNNSVLDGQKDVAPPIRNNADTRSATMCFAKLERNQYRCGGGVLEIYYTCRIKVMYLITQVL